MKQWWPILAQANDEALVLVVAVKAGADPLLQRRAADAADTFKKLADQYIAEHALRNARRAWLLEAHPQGFRLEFSRSRPLRILRGPPKTREIFGAGASSSGMPDLLETLRMLQPTHSRR